MPKSKSDREFTHLLASLLRPQRTKFWGSVTRFKPKLLEKVYGDGKRLLQVFPINERPRYWVVRVDSATESDLSEELIDDIYEQIDEQFGTPPEEDLGVGDERPYFPMFDGQGISWHLVYQKEQAARLALADELAKAVEEFRDKARHRMGEASGLFEKIVEPALTALRTPEPLPLPDPGPDQSRISEILGSKMTPIAEPQFGKTPEPLSRSRLRQEAVMRGDPLPVFTSPSPSLPAEKSGPEKGFIVVLEEGCWVAEGSGDPPRTTVRENAKVFREIYEAENALADARQYRRFRPGEVVSATGSTLQDGTGSE